MHATHFTDPACPFAFSAEPQRQLIKWHYGDQLEIATRMVGLAADRTELEDRGMSTAMIARGYERLRDQYGMPIDPTERPRMAATLPACRAVVATRIHAPERAEAVLRALRVRAMDGGLLDEPELIDAAAADAGVSAAELAEWIADPQTQEQLEADMEAARTPHPAALVLDHKLADAGDGRRRYTCPSWLFEHETHTVAVPGFQPWESYDSAIANLFPGVTRRPSPRSVEEILEWADEPLATAEVAALLGTSIPAAREQLETAGARFDGVADDGYWTAD